MMTADTARARTGSVSGSAVSLPAADTSWPPAGADPTATWVDGVDCGPLGGRADELFQTLFRRSLAAERGSDVPEPGYAGVIALVQLLVAQASSAAEITAASRRVLCALFPDLPPKPPPSFQRRTIPKGRPGLLYWFEVLFAKPFPAFSAKLNAWVTWWAGQWLMGPCVLQDIDVTTLAKPGAVGGAVGSGSVGGSVGGGSVGGSGHLAVGDGDGQQLLVRRCRFLEEAGCASVCVNACKMPTQAFFNRDMGVPMRMVPDYETLECRFQFGVPPTPEDEDEARSTPCFGACPAAGELRERLARCHTMGSEGLALPS